MPKILISKAFSFFILNFVLSLTNGTTYQEILMSDTNLTQKRDLFFDYIDKLKNGSKIKKGKIKK